MVTAEEIQSIELFTTLGREACERISRAAADISLTGGEYVAREGDERALCALLSGHVDVLKVVDGIENKVGERFPGHLIGEIPITLGTAFPVDFRATEPSRVMRLEAHDYHAIVADHPQISASAGKLAQGRLTGLQIVAAAPPAPRATVVGDKWKGACGELRRFLDRNQITYTWVTPDDADGEDRWGAPLPPAEEHPTLRVAASGKTVSRPSLRRVAELIELQTDADHAEYDTIIVGGGPAGLAAAVYGASEGLRTIVIEREAPGGQAGTSSRIENYLGFPSGVSGDELAGRALQQARRLGAEILVTRTLERIDPTPRRIYLDQGDVLQAKTVILACGVSWRRLDIDGFDRLAGKGISYGAARADARGTHGQEVHIVGAGNSAGQAALHFANHARSVTILCRGGSLAKSMSHYLIAQLESRQNIRVLTESEVARAHGEKKLQALEIRTGSAGELVREDSDGLYVFIGANAETGWLPDEVALDQRGYVLTGTDVRDLGQWALDRDPFLLETSVPGIFACGDVRSGPVKRVAAAVGEGSMAIAFVHQYLREAEPDS